MGFYLPIYHCASIFPGYHNRKHDFNSLGKTAILGEKLIIHFLNFFFTGGEQIIVRTCRFIKAQHGKSQPYEQ